MRSYKNAIGILAGLWIVLSVGCSGAGTDDPLDDAVAPEPTSSPMATMPSIPSENPTPTPDSSGALNPGATDEAPVEDQDPVGDEAPLDSDSPLPTTPVPPAPPPLPGNVPDPGSARTLAEPPAAMVLPDPTGREIEVIPSEITVEPGGSIEFSATLGGQRVAVDWSLTAGDLGGEITEDGRYTAPDVFGEFVLEAREPDGDSSGRASIRVTEALTTPSGMQIDFADTRFVHRFGVDDLAARPTLNFSGSNVGTGEVKPFLVAACGPPPGPITNPQGTPTLSPGQAMEFKVLLESHRCGFPAGYPADGVSVFDVGLDILDAGSSTSGEDRVVVTARVTVHRESLAESDMRLAGVVRDEDGFALDGANVEILTCCASWSTRAAADGAWEVDVPLVGEYRVRASLTGYEAGFLAAASDDLPPYFDLVLAPSQAPS